SAQTASASNTPGRCPVTPRQSSAAAQTTTETAAPSTPSTTNTTAATADPPSSSTIMAPAMTVSTTSLTNRLILRIAASLCPAPHPHPAIGRAGKAETLARLRAGKQLQIPHPPEEIVLAH